jgi:hypothetical protein
MSEIFPVGAIMRTSPLSLRKPGARMGIPAVLLLAERPGCQSFTGATKAAKNRSQAISSQCTGRLECNSELRGIYRIKTELLARSGKDPARRAVIVTTTTKPTKTTKVTKVTKAWEATKTTKPTKKAVRRSSKGKIRSTHPARGSSRLR